MNILTNIAPVKITLTILTVMMLSLSSVADAQVLVSSGSFHSVMPEVKGEPVEVDSFYLDKTAVTNKQYSKFLQDHENWQPGNVPSIFAYKGYLKSWENTNSDEVVNPDQPVTNVSWYAANAYCQSVGGRLPTLNEWEYSAQLMDFDSLDEAREFANSLMSWYSTFDNENIGAVGSTGIENRHGVKDQFGLIMEWVEDFKPVIANDLSLDCGTVGRMQKLGNAYSYAASIRYITRMSFSPKSTNSTVGFRCAYDVETIEDQKASL
ncbi:formylglycine-generating enzyme family protein [Fodinibius sp.]|uniref:formylglycine-generating enzyme family protein n=1 Tax=Fodinibius sp. TaxID=1872440 RepID=UPI002ACDBDB3|nr:formylglycine-generating enzyme family protein [Fodinibius sp.]MDZ7657701.1 formylglycine-generating enzyme family protein [Fodinibius sp.]